MKKRSSPFAIRSSPEAEGESLAKSEQREANFRFVSTHEQFADDLALYALDELMGAERHAMEEHLATCAACRRELQAVRSDLGLLGLSSSGPQPPARSKERLLRAMAAEPRGVSLPEPAPARQRSW